MAKGGIRPRHNAQSLPMAGMPQPGRTTVGFVVFAVESSDITFASSDGWHSVASVISDGADGAAPIVLLHGLSQQRHFWDPVLRRLRHRPVISLDQRGHGASTASADADFSIDRCAADVAELAAQLGVERLHVVGHSWGAAVALRLAAGWPELVASVALVDGGLWTPPALLGSRAEVLERLRPPALGIPLEEIWGILADHGMAAFWSDEVQAALEPTYVVGADGLARTVIGMDRHMAVLDGMFDYDPWPDAEAIAVPVWAAFCEPRTPQVDALRLGTIARAMALPAAYVQQWSGATHDVPVQWPALVAGFIDALVESADAARGDRGVRA
ncbi:MAG: alpha/beta fold hydrolase [Actinobacteria bacterium]|nr:alpha/beta fold hydrolase [Actinomycetota bacterium]